MKEQLAQFETVDAEYDQLLSTMAKYSKIDSAKESNQRQLRRFQEELADPDERVQVRLESGGFSKFADFSWTV